MDTTEPKHFLKLKDIEKRKTQKAVAALFANYSGFEKPATNKIENTFMYLANNEEEKGLALFQL